jgi:tRNA nucleotidyltransferase/poly(A) polymerase
MLPHRNGITKKETSKLLIIQSSAPPQIELDQVERDIFEFLLDADKRLGLGTTFRVAGGWVRDKLLGKESDDIDVALDTMRGEDFAERLRPLQGHPALGAV